MSARTIEQKMNAASVWNGAAPVGNAVNANDMESFPEGAVGGLFDFGNTDPIRVLQVFVKFGSGTTSWSLTLIDKDAIETIVASAANSDPLVITPHDGGVGGMLLFDGQKLKLVSVGGPTTASQARISVTSQVNS